MNKQQHPDRQLIQFILRVQQIALKGNRPEQGYAMLIVSMVSVVLLSLLAAALTMTNLSKSSTNAYVDGANTFYAAESGLNKRASQLREKFIDYQTPSGTVPDPLSGVISAANISNCFAISVNASVSATNDFECRNYPFRYNNNAASLIDANGGIVLSDKDGNSNSVNYIAHTFVAPKQNYATNPPAQQLIPPGETYAGLLAQEYKYTVYATATQPNQANTIVPSFTAAETAAKQRIVKEAGDNLLIESYDLKQSTADATNRINASTGSNANTVLQMDFTSRAVPLFQFAAFYDGDLEVSSASNMTISGWVHTNANLYVALNQSNTSIFTNFLSKITAAGSIYNRIDSATLNYGAIPRVLMTGSDCSIAANCQNFPPYNSTNQNPLTTGQINAFNGNVKDGVAGAKILKAPPPGFLRKRNYFDNSVGDYYDKADIRLEMVPDRDVTNSSTGSSAWNRNKAIIPFNFTSVQTGGTGTCVTTLPVQASVSATAPRVSIDRDPNNKYIDPNRSGASGLHCNVLTKGQLQSLRQPVLVLTDLNQPTTTLRTPAGSTPAAGSEAKILGRPASLSPLAGLSSTVTSNPTIILRALQVALASTPEPIAPDTLSKRFDDADYSTVNAGKSFKDEFARLLNTIPTTTLPSADRDKLLANTTTPSQIAALGNAWFLPAPIQRIESNQPVDTAVNNKRSSGFYDGREKRWMTILQTNIASLSVWNRDGLYVNASTLTGTTVTDIDNTLTTAYRSNDAIKNAAFNSGSYAAIDAAAAKGLIFVAATPVTPATPKGLQVLGLGSIESTEGGLVLYATVSDDLNGDGTISAADDVQVDTTNPILKKNPDGTNTLDASGSPITIDYPRKYRNGNIKQSPFGFAFNGADYLPGAMTLATDRAIYVQGNFNNNDGNPSSRLPASLVGDTIAVLSTQCLSTDSAVGASNLLAVPAGQLKCGLPRAATGSIDVPTSGTAVPYYSAASTTVNAAFLSSIDQSIGNLGVGRGFGSTTPRISGSLNNYMRMLEDWGWGTYTLNYSGSFVSLGTPMEANGRYVDGTYHAVPNRNFSYDTKFNSFANLPPLSPRAIYLKQDVFRRR